MEVNQRAVTIGIDSGVVRALGELRAFELPDVQPVREETRRIVTKVLEGYTPKRPWGPRGQLTFSELTAMAVAVRRTNREPPLTVEVANQFLNPITTFLFCWLHD